MPAFAQEYENPIGDDLEQFITRMDHASSGNDVVQAVAGLSTENGEICEAESELIYHFSRIVLPLEPARS